MVLLIEIGMDFHALPGLMRGRKNHPIRSKGRENGFMEEEQARAAKGQTLVCRTEERTVVAISAVPPASAIPDGLSHKPPKKPRLNALHEKNTASRGTLAYAGDG